MTRSKNTQLWHKYIFMVHHILSSYPRLKLLTSKCRRSPRKGTDPLFLIKVLIEWSSICFLPVMNTVMNIGSSFMKACWPVLEMVYFFWSTECNSQCSLSAQGMSLGKELHLLCPKTCGKTTHPRNQTVQYVFLRPQNNIANFWHDL